MRPRSLFAQTIKIQTETHYPAPVVGENSIGIRLDWRSFQAAIRRSASSSTWASRVSSGCLLLGSLPALVLHLATVEAHGLNARLPARLCKAGTLGAVTIWPSAGTEIL